MSEKEELMKLLQSKANEFKVTPAPLSIADEWRFWLLAGNLEELAKKAIKLEGLDATETELIMGILQDSQNT